MATVGRVVTGERGATGFVPGRLVEEVVVEESNATVDAVVVAVVEVVAGAAGAPICPLFSTLAAWPQPADNNAKTTMNLLGRTPDPFC